ncbi:unnamed protein product, partial [Rotaria sordida]
IAANDGQSTGRFSSIIQAKPELARPINFKALPGHESASIDLSWTRVIGATGYQIQQSSTNNDRAIFTIIATISNTSTTNYIDKSNLINGQTYYYKIAAKDGQSTGRVSPIIQGIPQLAPPDSFKAVTGHESASIDLSWTSVVGATGYEIQRSSTNNDAAIFTTIATISNTSTTYYIDKSNLINGQTYYYKIAAQDGQSTGRFSPLMYANPQLPSPHNFKAVTGRESASIDLSWTSVTGATAYEIQRSSTNNDAAKFTILATIWNASTTDYMDKSNLINAQTYYYRIAASDSRSTGRFSPIIQANPQLAPPHNFKAVTGHESASVDLSWTSVAGATGYEIQRPSTKNHAAKFTIIATIWNASTTDYMDKSKLINGQTYYYRIAASDGPSTGRFSSIIRGNPQLAPPANFKALASDESSSIDLSWTSVVGATGYEIQRSLDSYFTSKFTTVATISNGCTTNHVDKSNLTNGQIYYYKIVATDGQSTGRFSSIIQDYFLNMYSTIHRLPCKYGSQCEHIDDKEHCKTYSHPGFCIEKGYCKDMSELHLLIYRHVPLCNDGLSCSLFIKNDNSHCTTYRHSKNNCEFGLYCINFHNHEHIEDKNHPFNSPCPYTPYMCELHDKLLENIGEIESSISSNIKIHCSRYSHICPYGRQCTDQLYKQHIKSIIHIIRFECPNKENCQLIDDENHLNSYSHPAICDIRLLCSYKKFDCPDRSNLEHIKQYRHTGHIEHIGVIGYLGLNKNINFVQNHNEMIRNIQTYLQSAKWDQTIITISDELKQWIRALQPTHRCNKLIFESILVHGHIMSRDHMNSLTKSDSVAKAAKHHTKIKRIFDKINNPSVKQTCEEYIKILVEIQFNKIGKTKTVSESSEDELLKSKLQEIKLKLNRLDRYITNEDIETIRELTIEIAEASIGLHSNPTGIGFGPDQTLGTNKHVFGILGPHTGYYYGDIILVFRHELMYHPDSNFSIQAATTFGQSKNAYKFRPWLTDPGSPETRIEHFHRNKLHCSIPGYEDAAAYELMALTGLPRKSLTNIDLKAIQQRWLNIDSHCVFEAHLPQLIPLDYIDRVYIAKTTFDSLSTSAQQSAKTIFADALCITDHQIDISIKPAGLHQPLDPTRIPYQSFVVKEMCQTIENRTKSFPLIEGTIMTLPAYYFKVHIILPITISQSISQIGSTDSSNNFVYIYWKTFSGNMMLTLTDQIIDTKIEQKDLQCLTCYIAPWPSKNIVRNTTQSMPEYHEDYSYISNHHPEMHDIILHDKDFKASSNSFHRGSNIDDFIIYNLILDRTTNQVTLAIVGPNCLYSHHKLSYTFNKTELDLNNLEFIQISSGSHTVPIRNLIIRHAPIEQLHPLIDFDFIKTNFTSSGISTGMSIVDSKKLSNLCPNSIHCLLLYSDSEEGRKHNSQYTHLCHFSEKCRNKAIEPHLIHLPHKIPMCQYNNQCQQLADSIHRAQFRHSNLPDYLVPCRYQQNCRTKTPEHRIKYSHGENIPLPSSIEQTHDKTDDNS